ncbi:MAG: hypothetical protein HYX92_05520 [Chloroflexi bacterium]|nr:hypothetical protein [Chloroflexota bacterium]
MKAALCGMVIVFEVVVASLALFPETALAHERRAVGKYQLVVGFIVEPPFEGQKNGVDLRVTDAQTQKPVEGVEGTLQVEIAHVPTGVSKVLKLRTIFGDPGHYTADLLLTAPGHYRFRFFGAIEGLNVNETFNSKSGGGGFNDVESSGDIQFPVKIAEAREIEAATRGAQAAAQKASDAASLATNLAFVGIGLGALGIAAGAGPLIVGRKR